MTSYSRARRKRFIQEAEGYLELLHSISGEVLNHGHRHCLANRALDALDRLEPGDCRDGREPVSHEQRGKRHATQLRRRASDGALSDAWLAISTDIIR